MADKEQNRRKFFTNLGLTAGAGIIGSSFIKHIPDLPAEDCKTTPILELGPFAVMKYRKQADHDIDLTQIDGNAGVAFGQVIIVYGK